MSENNFKGFKGTEFKYPLLFAIKGLNNLENITEVESFEGNEHIDELHIQYDEYTELDGEYWHTECYAEYFDEALEAV